MQCGIRLPSVRARIPAECGIQSQRVRLPLRCSAVTGAGYELALGGSQTCNIWLPLTLLLYCVVFSTCLVLYSILVLYAFSTCLVLYCIQYLSCMYLVLVLYCIQYLYCI